jgi:hypothetical protein
VRAEDRADVDDAATGLAEMLHGFAGRQEIAQHVHVELLVERLLGQVGDHLEDRDTGIVDEHVDLAVVCHDRIEQARDVSGLGHVGLDGDRSAARRLDRRDHRVGAILAVPVVDDDDRAFGTEGLGDAGADAARCAGYDGDFSVQTHGSVLIGNKMWRTTVSLARLPKMVDRSLGPMPVILPFLPILLTSGCFVTPSRPTETHEDSNGRVAHHCDAGRQPVDGHGHPARNDGEI